MRVGVALVPRLDGVRDVGVERAVVPQAPGENEHVVGMLRGFHLGELAGEVHIGAASPDDGGDLVHIALAKPRAAGAAAFGHAAAVAVTAGLEEKYLGFTIRPDPPEGTLVNPVVRMARAVGVRPGHDIAHALLRHDWHQSP